MTDQTQKPAVPAEIPEAPPELQAKRQPIVDALEEVSKTATGQLQPVLRVMAKVLHNCRPGATTDPDTDRAMREAFQRYEPEMTKNPWPPVLEEAVAWMQDYLAARGFLPGDQSFPPRESENAVQGAGAQDVFEKVSNKPSLTGEQPVTPGTPPSSEGSLKNWQLNPGIGKVRG